MTEAEISNMFLLRYVIRSLSWMEKTFYSGKLIEMLSDSRISIKFIKNELKEYVRFLNREELLYIRRIR